MAGHVLVVQANYFGSICAHQRCTASPTGNHMPDSSGLKELHSDHTGQEPGILGRAIGSGIACP